MGCAVRVCRECAVCVFVWACRGYAVRVCVCVCVEDVPCTYRSLHCIHHGVHVGEGDVDGQAMHLVAVA